MRRFFLTYLPKWKRISLGYKTDQTVRGGISEGINHQLFRDSFSGKQARRKGIIENGLPPFYLINRLLDAPYPIVSSHSKFQLVMRRITIPLYFLTKVNNFKKMQRDLNKGGEG